jgi:predicted acylesterase/phospholipase RssA
MTLAGYLPPIWLNGSMLVDGGYLNVVPADVMARQGADTIIAVDVTGVEDNSKWVGVWVCGCDYISWRVSLMVCIY